MGSVVSAEDTVADWPYPLSGLTVYPWEKQEVKGPQAMIVWLHAFGLGNEVVVGAGNPRLVT